MAQPKFLLQPLTVAILAASNSTLLWANMDVQPDKTPVVLAPIVVTAQQLNDAN